MSTLVDGACLGVVLSALVAGAVELDPAHLSKYGAGRVVVSGKGALAKSKLDPSLVEMKGARDLVPGGPGAKLYSRVLLPKGETSGWDTQGLLWEEDMHSSLGPLLSEARAGWKLHVAYSVGITSKSPAGTIENKWDPDEKKFVPVASTGLLSRELGSPVAAATVEIVGGADEGKCKVRVKLAYTPGRGRRLRHLLRDGRRREQAGRFQGQGRQGGGSPPERVRAVRRARAGGVRPTTRRCPASSS